MTDYLSANTGTSINNSRTNSGLSTQIIVKINAVSVGALQTLTVSQNRPLARIQEIGTDGVIEIVPQGATTFELTAGRIVFDQLRLPEAFSRGFRFINAQRIPFDIDVIDISGNSPGITDDGQNSTVMTYKNCWFQRYETPYTAENYLITETATLWCETAYLASAGRQGENSSLRPMASQTDSMTGIEGEVNSGQRRGSLDAAGLIMSLFEGESL